MTPLERIEKLLAEMEAREKAATQGPYVEGPFYRADGIYEAYIDTTKPDDKEQSYEQVFRMANPGDWHTGHFLAHARTDMPRIVAALRQALSDLEQYGSFSGEDFRAVAAALEGK